MSPSATRPTRPRGAGGRRRLVAAFAAAVAVLLTGQTPSPALADAADAKLMKAGARSFNKCKACHNLTTGPKKMGPDLAGLFGRTAGSYAGYDKFSDAMKESGIVWDDETLAAYLESPRTVVPGGSMPFGGIRKDSEMEALLAYLKAETKAE